MKVTFRATIMVQADESRGIGEGLLAGNWGTVSVLQPVSPHERGEEMNTHYAHRNFPGVAAVGPGEYLLAKVFKPAFGDARVDAESTVLSGHASLLVRVAALLLIGPIGWIFRIFGN